jgi:hypothetical protein
MTSSTDPLALIDAVTEYAENLRGAVAVLVADGWTDEQARLLVLRAVLGAPQ